MTTFLWLANLPFFRPLFRWLLCYLCARRGHDLSAVQPARGTPPGDEIWERRCFECQASWTWDGLEHEPPRDEEIRHAKPRLLA